jgi:HK97 gp10 family phage protein
MQRNEGKVIADIEYAAFVELGTSDTPAQPFLAPAYESNKEAIKQDIIDKARAALRGAIG